jgi:hypothetical protein
MASSRPSPLLVEDDDDDWGSISPDLSSPPLGVPLSSSSRSSASSGEYNVFASIGSVIAEGGAKRGLWLTAPSLVYCCGKVGSTKMCVKTCGPGALSCGAQSHTNKFPLQESCAFVMASDFSVYQLPVLQLGS